MDQDDHRGGEGDIGSGSGLAAVTVDDSPPKSSDEDRNSRKGQRFNHILDKDRAGSPPEGSEEGEARERKDACPKPVASAKQPYSVLVAHLTPQNRFMNQCRVWPGG